MFGIDMKAVLEAIASGCDDNPFADLPQLPTHSEVWKDVISQHAPEDDE